MLQRRSRRPRGRRTAGRQGQAFSQGERTPNTVEPDRDVLGGVSGGRVTCGPDCRRCASSPAAAPSAAGAPAAPRRGARHPCAG
eukprot:3002429-Pyramimonas_sp.AAC.1